MMNSMTVLSPYKHKNLDCWRPYLVGGKAFNLYELTKKGISVPSWICISTEANSITDEISQEISALPSGKFWAVRSSGNLEDGKEASFAGQFETFLFVPKEKIIDQIVACWNSAHNNRLTHYLDIKDEKQKVKVGVVIQEMIDSYKSGVLFTTDPRSTHQKETIVISCGYGLGEGVVADLIETDTFFLDKENGALLHQEIDEKKSRIVFHKELGEGTIKEALPHHLSAPPTLTEKELSELFKIGKIIEKYYECPQDIEWAISKEGILYITQTRPITTLKPLDSKSFIFDNSNIVESFPGINTPLTLSLIRPLYEEVFSKALQRLGLTQKEVQAKKILFENLLAYYKGRVFYNITHWYEMMRLFPFTDTYIRVWEKMMGVEDSDTTPTQKEYKAILYLRFIKAFISLSYHFLFLDIMFAKLEKYYLATFAKFWEEEEKRSKKSKGYHHLMEFQSVIKSFEKEIMKGQEIVLINDIFAFVFSALTKKGMGQKDLFNEIMFDIDGMDSVGPITSLRQLAFYKRTLGDDHPTFLSSVQNHIEAFGDRGVDELKLETETMRENPNLLRQLIDQHSFQEKDLRKNSPSLFKKIFQIKRPLRSFLTYICARLSQRSILYREKFRLHRSRLYGVLRRTINRMGEHLFSQKFLDNPKDIYFLELEEIFAFSAGRSYARDLKKIIKERKNLYERYKKEEVASKYLFRSASFSEVISATTNACDSTLKGQGCSSGIVTGKAIVITDLVSFQKTQATSPQDLTGLILVAPMTDPGWVYIMTVAQGLIVEKGSILSHTAIIGRELGIPTIVGVKGATLKIKTGDTITMNAQTGDIFISH